MALEFHKLTEQVDRMGAYLANQEDETQDKLALALEIIEAFSGEGKLKEIHECVQHALDLDAGYRGSKPIDEAINQTFPLVEAPQNATLISTDGSQIMPNRHGSSIYYLINTGTIVIRHGSGAPPEISSSPALYYDFGETHLTGGGPVSGATVSARRSVAEMSALAEAAWLNRGEARPVIALLDNPILLFGMGEVEVPDQRELRQIYYDAMTRMRDVHAALAGYTDQSLSRATMGLLHLLDLRQQGTEISRRALSYNGRLEGLLDRAVFAKLLQPGERSALFVQMSPRNKEFRYQGGASHEVAFFYMNVAAEGRRPKIARVEVPMWVADDRVLIAEMQALLYQQCHQVASRYPYVITRAHELALVKHEEARQLDMMIKIAMTRHGLDTAGSEKQAGKDAVSGPRTRFKI